MNDAPIQSALEVMLTDGGGSHFVPPTDIVTGLARRPHRVARRLGALGAELTRVAAGRSPAAPAKRDRRFADPAWRDSWLYRRVLQTHLALSATADGLIDDAGLDWRAERQARFAVGNLLDALAPSNFPLTNPAVVKATVDEGGANLVRGARRFAGDFPHLPSTVDTRPFAVGENLAVTPGRVVARTGVLELLRYTPQTEQVYETPILFVPPTINKFYVLDLAPGRSLIEYLVSRGHQVFAISWRNPDAEQGHFDFDTYAGAILEARDTVAKLTGSPAVHLNAACSGGILSAGLLGHLADTDRLGHVASLTLMVSALDNERAGTASAFASREVAAAAVADSARRGYVDGQALAGVFTWLRPNDLVWNYVVHSYLLGKEPPAFDVLYWNQDTVRLAAGLHRDFIRLGLDNSLARPGGLTVLGSEVDLSRVTVDTYAVAGLTDHIIPWENAYRSTQLLGGDSRFILSTSGHIQALINPPGPESRSSFKIAGGDAPEACATRPGSWWPDYDEWLSARSGELVTAPNIRRRGAKAPGSYVHAR
jgi:poly[(R)-3-hydroxyalkanoate] polymerase subunit PhaC